MKLSTLLAFSSEFQHRVNTRWQGLRSVLYLPILSRLSGLGIKPDQITYARLILSIIFAFAYPVIPKIAVAIIMVNYFLDSVDGALARYENSASDRGKFFDILVDFVGYVLLISQFLLHNISPLLVVNNVWLVAVVWLLATIYQEEDQESDWIIKPYPQEVIMVAVPIGSFIVNEFFSFNLLGPSLLCSTLYALVVSIIYLHLILRRWGKI